MPFDRLIKVFQEELDTYVQETVIPAFVKALNLKSKDLIKVYNDLTQKPEEVNKTSDKKVLKQKKNIAIESTDTIISEYTENKLLKLKIAELKIICDKLHVSKSGIKATLIENILKVQNKPTKNSESKVKQNFSCIKPVELQLEKDDMGNLVFEDMVFIESYSDPAEKGYVVIGYKVDGKIKNLTTEKIDRCHELGLRYNDLSNINDAQETIILQKDEYGNIYFQDLIYDPTETEVEGTLIRYVIGYKDETGTIHPLDSAHKEKCKKLGQHIK